MTETGRRMRTIVISVIGEWWNYDDQPHRITDCTEGWAYALKGRFHGAKLPPLEELWSYDLIMANLDVALIPRFAEIIENRPAEVKWVSTIEGCGTDYYNPSPDLLKVMNASDLVATINRHTTGYLRSLSPTRTEWIGIPFPAEEVAAFATPPEQRRDEALICPRRNYNPSIMVAHALGLPISTYLGKVSRKPRNLPLFWKHRYFGADLNLRQWEQAPSPVPRISRIERGLTATWQEAGGCKIWINLDPRYTWGRWVLEAAAMEMPIIATESTDHASFLFPETTVRDVFAVEEAIAIGKRLLAEPEWARQVCKQARERLEIYSPKSCVQRLSAALDMPLP